MQACRRDKLGIMNQIREWIQNIKELTTMHRLKLFIIEIYMEITMRLK